MRVLRHFILAGASLVVISCGSEIGPGSPGEAPDLSGSSSRYAKRGSPLLVAGEQLSCLVGDTTSCRGGNAFLRPEITDDPAAAFSLEAVDEIAIGDHHACLLVDGSVSCWGSNLMGQLGTAQTSEVCIDRPCSRKPVPIDGLPPIRAIAAGSFHTLALSEDGSVWGWGANSFAQLGPPMQTSVTNPIRIAGITNATAISAGAQQGFAVLADGVVLAWGNTGAGRLGSDSDDPFISSPVKVPGLSGPASQVTTGAEHACALLQDGTVECWGANRFGQLGDGTTDSRPEPGAVDGLPEEMTEVAAGSHFTCARSRSGAILCWGWNDNGQLGQGFFDGPEEPGGFSASTRPVEVSGLPGPATSLAGGPGFACALAGEAVWCWGRNEVGQLGHAGLTDQPSPVQAGSSGVSPAVPGAQKLTIGQNGLDISYHSGRVDWERVAAQDYSFAFTLSTAGLDFHDPFFDSHWQRMRRLHRGAYHFFVAEDDPAQQARWFIANTPMEAGDLAPVVDIETLGDNPPSDLGDRLKIFVDLVHQHYGIKPIVYTGPTFWNQNLGEGWGDHALWIAEYQVDAPAVPTGWQSWTLWQNRGNADLDGVERVVDLNRTAEGFDLGSLTLPVR